MSDEASGGTDVALVIEVADSSLFRDQRDKSRIYASAGIPGYWIVSLVDASIEIYDQPDSASPGKDICGCRLSPRQTLPFLLGVGSASGGRTSS
ncbi:MAG: Uma2 family endonuclease [Gemmataceae bacterium]